MANRNLFLISLGFLLIFVVGFTSAVVEANFDVYSAVIEEDGSVTYSGNPVDVVIKALEIVSKNVGHTVNTKGYKVLHPSYRIIQGDGVDTQEIQRILDYMEGKGWSAENVAFGMGGGLLQHMDRDTQRFAMKCSVAVINGEIVEVFKAPKTDMSKASKKGFLDLVVHETYGGVETTSTTDLLAKEEGNPYSIMETVFEDGVVMNLQPLERIRELSDTQCKVLKEESK